MKCHKGIISSWKDDKGFGFITPELKDKDVFVHIKNYSKKHNRPEQGLVVFYELSTDKTGRTCAIDVIPANGHTQPAQPTISLTRSIPTILFVGLFFAFVSGLILLNKIPHHTLTAYAILSLITFMIYVKDKSAARAGEWRTPESTLHMFALIGGWPGAALAQSMLRHKSKKASFRFVYWITVTLNICTLTWFALPKGQQQSLIEIVVHIKAYFE